MFRMKCYLFVDSIAITSGPNKPEAIEARHYLRLQAVINWYNIVLANSQPTEITIKAEYHP